MHCEIKVAESDVDLSLFCSTTNTSSQLQLANEDSSASSHTINSSSEEDVVAVEPIPKRVVCDTLLTKGGPQSWNLVVVDVTGFSGT